MAGAKYAFCISTISIIWFHLQGIASFIQLAKKSGVCIAVSVTINRNADDKEFDDVVNTLLNKEKARVSFKLDIFLNYTSSCKHSF